MFKNLLSRAKSLNPSVEKQSPRGVHTAEDHESEGSHIQALKAVRDSYAIVAPPGADPDPTPSGLQQCSSSKADILHYNDVVKPVSKQPQLQAASSRHLQHDNQHKLSDKQEQALQRQQELLQTWQQEQAASAYAAEQDPLQQQEVLKRQQKNLDLVQQQRMQSQQEALVQQQPRMGGVPTIEVLQVELSLQQRAREELEDMLLRYERQLKAESAARSNAEQKAQAAAVAADEARQQLASSGRQAKQRTATLAAEQEAVRQERAALESMRVDFEGQLQSARAEVAKAQAAMKSTEEHVRATAAAEKAALVSEYESHIATLAGEMERLRTELTHRTASMTAEMNRWKHQAALTAAAVVEAKNEVMERQRELHSTNAKMDHLIERLYGHREANIVLSGAIAAAAEHQQAATNSFLQQQAAMAAYASLHNTASMHPMQPMLMPGQTAQTNQLAVPSPEAADVQQALHRTTASGTAAAARCSAINTNAGYSSTVKSSGSRAGNALVPTAVQQKKSMLTTQQHVGMLSDAGAWQPQLPASGWHYTRVSSVAPGMQLLDSLSKIPPFLSAALGDAGMSNSGQSCNWLPPVRTGGTTTRKAVSSSNRASVQPHPPQPDGGAKGGGGSRSPSTSKSPKAVGSYAVLHQQQQLGGSAAAATSPCGKADLSAYAQTGSKYAESAAKYAQSHQQKAKQQQKQRDKQQKPDRFAEGAKNAAMIAAMASRW